MFQVRVITPQMSHHKYLKEFLGSYELFYFFALRDIKVRYKQAFFGIAWAIIRPLLNMCVFVFIFSRMAHFSSGSVNYSLFVLLPMLFWLLFSAALTDTSNSLIINANVLTKIYFPRMVLPLSSIIVHLADFSIGLFAFVLLASWSMSPLQVAAGLILSLPFFLLSLMLCLGTGLWLAALTARYRDFRFIIPFTIQFGLFISPVGYPASLVSSDWLWFYSLNPLVGIIEGLRWAMFGSEFTFLFESVALSCLVTALLLVSGYSYFRMIEHDLADII